MLRFKTFEITLTNTTPLRVGGKPDPLSEADNPVSVVGGRLCIPGPSLKGAYRAELERFLNDTYFDTSSATWQDSAFQPCIPSSRLSSDEEALVSRKRYRRSACSYATGSHGRGHGRRGHESRDVTICPACYFLGAMGLVGFVSVPFLFADVSYESLYSARIDRSSRTVAQGANRSYQLVPQDTQFMGRLEVLIEDDLLGWRLGLPRPLKEVPNADKWLESRNASVDEILGEFIVNRFSALTRIGGYQSKGFGRVTVQLKENKG